MIFEMKKQNHVLWTGFPVEWTGASEILGAFHQKHLNKEEDQQVGLSCFIIEFSVKQALTMSPECP